MEHQLPLCQLWASPYAVIQQHRQAQARPMAVSQTVAASEALALSWDAEEEPLAA